MEARGHARRQTPGADPLADSPLAEALRGRAEGIARRWVEGLAGPDRRTDTPDPTLLRAARRIVGWVTGDSPGRTPEDVPAALRDLTDRRVGRARLSADPYRDFQLLSRLLEEALREELEGRAGGSDAAGAAALSARLHRALLTALGVAGDVAEAHRAGERKREMEAFASMVRHELRNPLGAAHAAAQLLREDGAALSEEQEERVLRSLERSVRQAVDLLASVTALSHGGSDADVERWEPLRTVLDDAVALVREHAPEGVDVRVTGSVPDVLVDADRLEILVHNLVENGVKYRDGTRAEPHVHVEVEEDGGGDAWWVRVRDNGVGIDPGERERIFLRFYRAADGEVEGSGLGLAIAREAARQMGGELEVESTPGEGSVFSARIPRGRTRPMG